jgi:NadR type nicotinamide-nucleotide adenylyltransferase
MRYGLGVVIGKFLPPHAGHHFLIDTALEQADVIEVIICAKPSDPYSGSLRASWLRERHPAAAVRVIDDRYDENDSKVWAQNTIHWLGRAPDVVFTSESYGDAYSAFMGCKHVCVDMARNIFPTSGTQVRENPYKQWDYLSPAVRAHFAKRICVVGAESTGTTTLALDIAEKLNTVCVPEYGREYCEIKNRKGVAPDNWTDDEFLHIATEQSRRETEAARQANRFLICDTNAFATTLWQRRYLHRACPNTRSSERRRSLELKTKEA